MTASYGTASHTPATRRDRPHRRCYPRVTRVGDDVPMRVLVAEDHAELAEDIAEGLRDRGIAADVAFDGAAAIQKGTVNPYDVIVLDRDLPAVHGDAVCRSLRSLANEARILMLTASTTIADRVEGLNLGADDYLTKPFAFDELVARVHALARRAPAAAPIVVRGGITLDRARRRATRDGRELMLNRKELGVLEALMVADGSVVSARTCSSPSGTRTPIPSLER